MSGLRLLLILVVVGSLALALLLYLPFGPHTETFVDIPPGTSTGQMAKLLRRNGIIRSSIAFQILHVVHRRSLEAGEYRFDKPTSVLEVYRRIAVGDVYTRAVLVPEGFNLFDIAAAVAQAGLGPADTFLAAARQDTRLITDLSPNAHSLEGFLFPDTYRFSRHATPDQILTAMVRRFRQKTAALQVTPETLILASLIEKEVRDPAERPLVAGVFRNRLARAMPLATDPTVIYAALLDHRAASPKTIIFRSDLDAPSPYNTYRHPGLPPGPICNPGLASLQAALHPARTDFLYFVADSTGHSRFASSLAGHNQNVRAYRQSLSTARIPPPLPDETPKPSSSSGHRTAKIVTTPQILPR